MLIGSIRDANGEVLEQIRIPERASEVTYEQFIELSHETAALKKWLTEKIKNDLPYEMQYVKKVVRILSSVLGIDHKVLAMLPTGRNESTENSAGSLFGIWYYFGRVVFSYKPKIVIKGEDCVFFHRGQKYKIPAFYKDVTTGKSIPEDLTVLQVIECSDYEVILDRFLSLKTDSIKMLDGTSVPKVKADAINQYQFNLKKIALLTADINEIPVSDSELESWLNERMKLFSDITMDVGINVCFFLENI